MRRLIGRKWLVRAMFSLVALGGLGAAVVKSEALPCNWWKESYYDGRAKVGECGLSCHGGPYCWGRSTEHAVYVEGDCGNCEAQR
jgi:hypothetical protein